MTIKFKLFDLDNVSLFEKDGEPYVSWFSLTDGDLWIDFGKANFYEYTHEAVEYFSGKSSTYNDYFIVRFIEDFTELFMNINENIPLSLYENTCDFDNLIKFLGDIDEWYDKEVPDEQEENEDEHDFYFEKIVPLTSWIHNRQLDSGHLQGGPKIWFFRCEEQMRIIWKADDKIEDKINMWTSQYGQFRLPFSSFKKEVKRFGEAFFQAMDEQVHLAVEKDWKDVKIDKIQLLKEHRERYVNFYLSLSKLDEESKGRTDWNKIDSLVQEMKNSLS
jgi:hypothetical protein